MTTSSQRPQKMLRKGLRRGAPKGNKNAVGNRGGPGAPTLYHDGVPAACYRMALLGATDAEMAEIIGIGLTTFEDWKRRYVELTEALRVGKVSADAEVAAALFKRAIGFHAPTTKVFVSDGKAVHAHYEAYYPPDTTACRYWLNNRQRGRWKDRISEEDAPQAVVNFNIYGFTKKEKDRAPPEPRLVEGEHAFRDPARR